MLRILHRSTANNTGRRLTKRRSGRRPPCWFPREFKVLKAAAAAWLHHGAAQSGFVARLLALGVRRISRVPASRERRPAEILRGEGAGLQEDHAVEDRPAGHGVGTVAGA